jgi:hypothetical protein
MEKDQNQSKQEDSEQMSPEGLSSSALLAVLRNARRDLRKASVEGWMIELPDEHLEKIDEIRESLRDLIVSIQFHSANTKARQPEGSAEK